MGVILLKIVYHKEATGSVTNVASFNEIRVQEKLHSQTLGDNGADRQRYTKRAESK